MRLPRPLSPMRLFLTTPLLTTLLLATLLLLASPAVAAQDEVRAACTNGVAEAFPCANVDLVARLTRSELDVPAFPGRPTGNDIWGWTDPETGVEYALVGMTEGTVFVSLAEPTAPTVIGTLPSETSVSIWRDIKTYGSYAYIVSEASAHGMQVFDLRRLRDVTAPPVEFEADTVYREAGSAHNIVIDEDLPYAFLVGADQSGFTCNGGGLHIVSLEDPAAPTFAGCFDNDGYTHDAQCVRYDGPDPDYQGEAICFSSNGSFGSDDVLSISNVSDPTAPVGISLTSYPLPGYAHQGWLTEDKQYFLMNDEFDEGDGTLTGTRTLIFDVSDLDDPVFVGPYIHDILTIDHNLYIRGNYVYQSNYESGLRVFELTDLANAELTLAASFDTFPSRDGLGSGGQWSNYPFFESGLIIANDQGNGLFVLRSGTLSPTGGEGPPETPELGLSAAYPNPFRTRTTIDLALAQDDRVRAVAYDLLGRRVATLFDRTVSATTPVQLTLDGTNLPSGVYLIRVQGTSFAETRRVTLVR